MSFDIHVYSCYTSHFYLVLYVYLVKQFEFCIVFIILQFQWNVKVSIKGNLHNLSYDFQFDNFTLEPFHVCFFILLSTFNCHMQKFSVCVLPSDTNTYLNSKNHIMLNKRWIKKKSRFKIMWFHEFSWVINTKKFKKISICKTLIQCFRIDGTRNYFM